MDQKDDLQVSMQHPSGNLLNVLQQAIFFHDQGLIRDAEALYQRVLTEDNRHLGALSRLGMLRLQQRRFEEAADLFRRAVKADKRSAEAHQHLAFALTGLGLFEEAVRSYQKAITLQPSFSEAHNNLGYALQVLGRFEEAIGHYNKALKIRPDYAEARNNLGNALHLLNRSAQSISHYESAIALKPDYAEACWNLGTALRALGRFDEAIAQYEKAASINPKYIEAYNGWGNALRTIGRYEDAAVQYEKALAIDPNYSLARRNLGDVLLALGRSQDAIAEYDRVLSVVPDDVDALCKRGNALSGLKRYGDALSCYHQALNIAPDNEYAFSGLAQAAAAACNWQLTERLRNEASARVSAGQFFDAFNFLGYSDDPSLQLRCARTYIRHEVRSDPKKLLTEKPWRNEKIRIAYLSCGFHKHPSAYMSAELYEIHDRTRFDVFGFSTGPDDQSEIRARLIRAFDQFHDVRMKSDEEVARLIHDLRVDIVIDRSGYTTNARPGILASRPAPIHVNYQGYPGTLGVDFYDYIVADKTVLPLDQQPYFAEKIVHLPDCFQSNDSKRQIAAQTPTRKSAELPDQGFVFCSFNHCFKITPDIFDIWMRLLARVEGSVLWLLYDNATAEENLRREAAARGINPNRLVFAGRVALDQHLARHRLADLFLDTLPFNAHTTASDALWTELPVVTCYGKSFAGRVAASMLTAIGVPELITYNLEAYEALALKLATEPSFLEEIRERLRRNRLVYPLFDSQRYRRQIEAAYYQMWELWQNGESPRAFAVNSERPVC